MARHLSLEERRFFASDFRVVRPTIIHGGMVASVKDLLDRDGMSLIIRWKLTIS
jgi:hypothetical protein